MIPSLQLEWTQGIYESLMPAWEKYCLGLSSTPYYRKIANNVTPGGFWSMEDLTRQVVISGEWERCVQLVLGNSQVTWEGFLSCYVATFEFHADFYINPMNPPSPIP